MLNEDLILKDICNEPLSSEERTVIEYYKNTDPKFHEKWTDLKVKTDIREYFTNKLDKSAKDELENNYYFNKDYSERIDKVKNQILIDIYCENETLSEKGQKLFNLRKSIDKSFAQAIQESLKLNEKINNVLIRGDAIDLKLQLTEIHNNEIDAHTEGRFDNLNTKVSDEPIDLPITNRYNVTSDKVTVKQNSGKVVFIKKLSVAASIALLVGVFCGKFFFNPEEEVTPDQLYISYYEPYRNTYFNKNNPGMLVNEGLFSYQAGEYKKAGEIFMKLAEHEELRITALFYLGLINMELHNLEKSIAYLGDNSVIESQYAIEAKWYLSLCYVRMKETEKAKLLLEELALSRNKYSNKIDELLESLH